MYEVKIDGRMLYYPNDNEYILSDAKIETDMSDAGSFEFTVPVINPEYENIVNRSSMIQVLKNGEVIFNGEVREIQTDYFKNKQVFVVGEISFLYDTIQPQHEYHNMTPRQLLEAFINNHNALVNDKKKFTVGIVTVTDPNDSLYRYTNRESTYQAIKEKLTDDLGGYIKIRNQDGIRYIDLLSADTYGKTSNQEIHFSENLFDYSSTLSASDLSTACIPLGATLETADIEALESRVTVESVNGGKEYIFIPEAVNAFGWIQAVVTFDNITLPQNLLKAGQEWLSNNQFESLVLDVSAVDMSDLGTDCDSFELGDFVKVVAEPYGMNKKIQITKVTTDLLDPKNNTFILGSEGTNTMTSIQANNLQESIQEVVESNTFLQSKITNATAMMTGSSGGYKLEEFDSTGKWIRTLYMDAPRKQDARNIIQINMNGIGFTTGGYNGTYKNAWTIDGNLVADFITSGTMSADRIQGGELRVGGISNTNGIIHMYDSNGKNNGTINNSGLLFSANAGLDSVSIASGTNDAALVASKIYSGTSKSEINTFNSEKVHIREENGSSSYSILASNHLYLCDGEIWMIDSNSPGYEIRLSNDLVQIRPGANFSSDVNVTGSLSVSGSKNRKIDTESFGEVLLSAYETPTPMFGDIGTGLIGECGTVRIFNDPRFMQCIDSSCEYQVFLQPYGEGSLFVLERKSSYFIVKGTPGLEFGWEMKAKQINLSQKRFNQKAESIGTEEDLGFIGANYYKNYIGGIIND